MNVLFAYENRTNLDPGSRNSTKRNIWAGIADENGNLLQSVPLIENEEIGEVNGILEIKNTGHQLVANGDNFVYVYYRGISERCNTIAWKVYKDKTLVGSNQFNTTVEYGCVKSSNAIPTMDGGFLIVWSVTIPPINTNGSNSQRAQSQVYAVFLVPDSASIKTNPFVIFTGVAARGIEILACAGSEIGKGFNCFLKLLTSENKSGNPYQVTFLSSGMVYDVIYLGSNTTNVQASFGDWFALPLNNIDQRFDFKNPSTQGIINVFSTDATDVPTTSDSTSFNLSLNYRGRVVLSGRGSINVYQSGYDEVPRLTIPSSFITVINNLNFTTFEVDLFPSTLNLPNTEYYVTVDDGMVLNANLFEPLPGIKPGVWNFTTAFEKTLYSVVLRFDPKSRQNFVTNTSATLKEIHTEISRFLPVEIERISTPNSAWYYDQGLDHDYILVPITIEPGDPPPLRLSSDLEDLIFNLPFTNMKNGTLTSMLDSKYGAQIQSNFWVENRAVLILAGVAVLLVILLYIAAEWKDPNARNFAVPQFVLILADFSLAGTVIREAFYNEEFLRWFKLNTAIASAFTVLGSTEVEVLSILNSRVGGIKTLQAPWSDRATTASLVILHAIVDKLYLGIARWRKSKHQYESPKGGEEAWRELMVEVDKFAKEYQEKSRKSIAAAEKRAREKKDSGSSRGSILKGGNYRDKGKKREDDGGNGGAVSMAGSGAERKNASQAEIFMARLTRCIYKIYVRKLDGAEIIPISSNKEGTYMVYKKSSLMETMLVGVKMPITCVTKNPVIPKFIAKLISPKLRDSWGKESHLSDTADVMFIIGEDGEKLFANSAILAKKSKYFGTLFEENFGDCVPINESLLEGKDRTSQQQYEIRILDFSYETVLQMLRFIYTGEAYISTREEIYDIFSIAEKYMVTALKHKSRRIISGLLNVETAAEILFKHAWKHPELKREVMDFMIKNFSQVRKTDGYKRCVRNYTECPMFSVLKFEILMASLPEP
ncbi:4333_t:CDS:10 [Acaulospora colombiana]|uniref:4333_t:CDS:1 n=1 Tax=Acaulospora colombiana TaxID=27376 RepID=A0ACA9K4J5_9GLOM|nr:4333_t:CDS:10 [Acaulospora colombiana]